VEPAKKQNGFAVKLNADKLAQGADHAILSSNRFPRDKREIHLQDGVIVAAPARVLLTMALVYASIPPVTAISSVLASRSFLCSIVPLAPADFAQGVVERHRACHRAASAFCNSMLLQRIQRIHRFRWDRSGAG